MSVASDIFEVIKRIMLVSEDLTRMNTEVKEMSADIADHEGRLIRIETTLALAGKQSRVVLPGS